MLGMLETIASYLGGINPWAAVFILGILPITEVRIAVLYGSLMHLNPAATLIIAIAANILEIPIIFLLFSRAENFRLAQRFFGKSISKKITRFKGKFEKYDELALLLFVASQVPGTGGFTGAFVCEILKLDRKKAFAVICLGIVINAIVVFAGVTAVAAALGY